MTGRGRGRAWTRLASLGLGVAVMAITSCGRHTNDEAVDAGQSASSAPLGDSGNTAASDGGVSIGTDGGVLRFGSFSSATAPRDMAPVRPGMVWVPPGTFSAGTSPDHVPRVAEEELPAVPVTMHGFYMDLLPYPNEAGAIATTNVARDYAAHLCGVQGKRLCTELEWERACKGEGSTTYEYGDAYRASVCGTGVAAEVSSRQPTGEKLACTSAFGVRDMHGGAWEWTSSSWGRGTTSASLGVLRGGNAAAGELAGRCANALGRQVSTRGATMGFRCCAGPENEAKVDLTLAAGPVLEHIPGPSLTTKMLAPLVPLITGAWFTTQAGALPDGGTDPHVFGRAWIWRPVANELLVIVGGCARAKAGYTCGATVAQPGTLDGADATDASRPASPGGSTSPTFHAPAPRVAKVLAEVESGVEYPEIVQTGDSRRLRMRGLEFRGTIIRELIYSYGLVDVGPKRY